MIKLIFLVHVSLTQPSPAHQQWVEYQQALLNVCRQNLIQSNTSKKLWDDYEEAERRSYHQLDSYERRFQ